MKQLTTIILFLISHLLFSQQINNTIKNGKGNLMLLGKTNKKAFDKGDFSWFKKNYNEYLTNDKVITRLQDSLASYSIKVFYGSWCGDSKLELPRFYKIIDQAKFNKKQLEVIAVDRKSEAYKQAPNREEKGLNIHRVPTFIFYKNGIEVNRIVEHPKETIERDILLIVNNKRYRPNYRAVSYIDKLFTTKPKDSIQLIKNKLASFLPQIAKGAKELNTYGFVNLRAKDFEKAKFAFELNAKMYPNHYVPYSSLGEYYFEQKQYHKALENYYKSLSFYPKNENVKEMITKTEEFIKKQ